MDKQGSNELKKPLVYCMLSGGVDSSVAAACLLEQGYQVKGVFMKCWSLEQLRRLGLSEDLYGCFWEDDSNDAFLVAQKLGIDFEVWDLQEEYYQYVVTYMLEEYKQGKTPNPDIMCNSFIKFGFFYEKARAAGAEYVASGHYARIGDNSGSKQLLRAKDHNKDQSYFLCRIKRETLKHVLFPIGEFDTKADVRHKAEEANLVTAHKPDSQGLCFIGATPLRAMLKQVYGQKNGAIVTQNWEHAHSATKITKQREAEHARNGYVVIGQHDGAFLYTIGQRNQLGLSGGPWLVQSIDVERNLVFVTHETSQGIIDSVSLRTHNLNWFIDVTGKKELVCEAQIRYRQKAQKCVVIWDSEHEVTVNFDEAIRAVAKGQSVAFYDGEVLLGSGIIL